MTDKNYTEICSFLSALDDQIEKAEEAARKAEKKTGSLILSRNATRAAAEIATRPEVLARFEAHRLASGMGLPVDPNNLDHVLIASGWECASILMVERKYCYRGNYFNDVAKALDVLRAKGLLD